MYFTFPTTQRSIAPEYFFSLHTAVLLKDVFEYTIHVRILQCTSYVLSSCFCHIVICKVHLLDISLQYFYVYPSLQNASVDVIIDLVMF